MQERNVKVEKRDNKERSYAPKHNPILNTSRTLARGLFLCPSRPWEAIFSINNYIYMHGRELPFEEYDEISENIWVHISAYLSPTAKLEAPCIICSGAHLSHGVSVSGSIIGSSARLGENSVVKNSILFDRATLCANNFVGSSVIGYNAYLDAGATLPQSRLDGAGVLFDMPDGVYISGKARLGAVICDEARIGALSVIGSGSVIDGSAIVRSGVTVSGYIPPYYGVR